MSIGPGSRQSRRQAPRRRLAARGPARERRTRATTAGRAVTIASALAASALLGCTPVVEGNGQYRALTFDGLPNIHAVSIGSGVTATVTVNGAANRQTVVLSGDDNVVGQYLTVEVVDGVLETKLEGISELEPKIPPTLVVGIHTLDGVTAREGARVTANGVAAAALRVEASGRSDVALSGAVAGVLAAALSGGSLLDAKSLTTGSAQVSLAGASSAELQTAGVVSGTGTGGSTVRVFGGGTCGIVLADGSTCLPSP